MKALVLISVLFQICLISKAQLSLQKNNFTALMLSSNSYTGESILMSTDEIQSFYKKHINKTIDVKNYFSNCESNDQKLLNLSMLAFNNPNINISSQYTNACKYLDNYENLFGSSPEYLYNRALINAVSNNKQSAYYYFNLLAQNSPSYVNTDEYYYNAGLLDALNGRFDYSNKYLQNVGNKYSSQAHYNIALNLYNKQNYSNTKSELKHRFNSYFNIKKAILMGNCNFKTNKFRRANKYFGIANLFTNSLIVNQNKGFTSIKVKHYRASKRNFNKILKSKQNQSVAYYGLAEAETIKKNYSEALDLYEKALKFDNSNIDAIIGKANCLVNLNQLLDAFYTYNEAIALDSYSFEAYKGRAIAYYLSNQYYLSIIDFNTCNKLNNSFVYEPEVYIAQIQNYKFMNDLNNALIVSEIAVKNYPDNYDLNVAHGNILFEMWDYNEAAKYYSKAIKIVPKNYLAHQNLGNANLYLYNYHSAENNFRNALKHNPEALNSLNGIGNIYRNMQKYEQSIEILDFARLIYPENSCLYSSIAMTYNEYAQFYEFNGKTKTSDSLRTLALNFIDSAIIYSAYESKYAHVNNRGLIYKDNKEYDKAIADFTYTDNWVSFNNMGIVYALTNKSDSSNKCFNLSAELDTSRTEPLYNLQSLSKYNSFSVNYQLLKKINGLDFSNKKQKYQKDEYIGVYYYDISNDDVMVNNVNFNRDYPILTYGYNDYIKSYYIYNPEKIQEKEQSNKETIKFKKIRHRKTTNKYGCAFTN